MKRQTSTAEKKRKERGQTEREKREGGPAIGVGLQARPPCGSRKI